MTERTAKPGHIAVAPGEPPVVDVQGLWTTFGKGNEAFSVHQDLQLSVQRGEILALVGGSGTGKTVLLRQMLGLAWPTRGSVTVLGQPASEMGREGAASRVGMLFQHGALYSAFNVLDNIAFALRELGTLPPALAPSPPSSVAGRPSTVTLPRVGRVRPSMWRSSTVLPVPEPPTSARISPRRTVSCSWSCTVKALSPWPKTVAKSRISMMVSASAMIRIPRCGRPRRTPRPR